MRKHAIVVVGSAALAFVVVAIYLSNKNKKPASATAGAPINTLPARRFAQNWAYNPQAQPPSPTFTPFSGAPVVEIQPVVLDSGIADVGPPDFSNIQVPVIS